MTSPFTRAFTGPKPQEAAMLPGNRFFVRRLSVEGDDVPGQVNLALEAISPFPLEQMLVGFVTSADGKQVLAYAAHRRRFTAEESFAWPEDCQVVPEFLALCGHRAAVDGVIVLVDAGQLPWPLANRYVARVQPFVPATRQGDRFAPSWVLSDPRKPEPLR